LAVEIGWKRLQSEGQVLRDAVSVGGVHHGGFAESATALGVLGLEQMAPARFRPKHLAARGQFEPFGDGLSRFNAFGTTHNLSLSLEKSAQYKNPQKWKQAVFSSF
jgi:hypothetical protein